VHPVVHKTRRGGPQSLLESQHAPLETIMSIRTRDDKGGQNLMVEKSKSKTKLTRHQINATFFTPYGHRFGRSSISVPFASPFRSQRRFAMSIARTAAFTLTKMTQAITGPNINQANFLNFNPVQVCILYHPCVTQALTNHKHQCPISPLRLRSMHMAAS
jgi:hypothetical protein